MPTAPRTGGWSGRAAQGFMLDEADARTKSAVALKVGAPDAVVRNVEAVLGMRVRVEADVGAHQKAIERLTNALGRPRTLYVVVAFVVSWSIANLVALRVGVYVPDPPPFFWLQGMVGLAALLVATLVLITQNRHALLSDRRERFELQVNLLTEQKTAKVIELIEELRRDLPNVRNRRDREAEAMQCAAEPLLVDAALDARARVGRTEEGG